MQTDPVLHQFPPMPGLPSLSPFCVKVHMALRAKGVAYQVNDTLFPRRVSPRGKLPVLEIGGQLVEDSSHILRYLEDRHPEPALYPSSAEERARCLIIEDWADESLYWHGVYKKFIDDDGWLHVRRLIGESLPAPVRTLGPRVARRKLASHLSAQGLTRRPRQQIEDEFAHHLDALDCLLAGGGYLVGKSLTVADLAVTAMLAQLTTGLTPSAARAIGDRPNLAGYLQRIRDQTLG